MPVKHIPDGIYAKLEKKHMDAIIYTKRKIKDAEFIEFVLKRGLASLDNEAFEELSKKRVGVD
ncbi:MAG TPA: hypothetical protein PK002_16625 [Cellvibrio sp.]|nr:hypothetical protein [Cellvibrio sp.]